MFKRAWSKPGLSGTQSITKQVSSALSANDLLQNGIYEFCYDGTNSQVMAIRQQRNYQSVSRSTGQIYTNSLPYEIYVAMTIAISTGSANVFIEVDSVLIMQSYGVVNQRVSFCFPVPAGSTYECVMGFPGVGTLTVFEYK